MLVGSRDGPGKGAGQHCRAALHSKCIYVHTYVLYRHRCALFLLLMLHGPNSETHLIL